MFHIAKHRHQTILAAQLDGPGLEVYRDVKGNTEEQIILKTAHKIDLQALLKEVDSGGDASFLGNLATISNDVVTHGVKVRITNVLQNRPLRSAHQDEHYPSGFMPFYIYGTPNELHIDHILTRAPNITLSAGNVELVLDKGPEEERDADRDSHRRDREHHFTPQHNPYHRDPRRYDLDLLQEDHDDAPNTSLFASAANALDSRASLLTIEGVHKAAMQPFGDKNEDLPPPEKFFFAPGKTFAVKVWKDLRGAGDTGLGLADEVFGKQRPIATGTLTLGEEVVVDVEKLNRDPWKEEEDEKVARWIERFGRIGRDIEADEQIHTHGV